MKKVLIQLFCCAIPVRSWRKKVRNRLLGVVEASVLEENGFILTKDFITTPAMGVKFHVTREAEFIISEVFLHHDYGCVTNQPSIAIDIGMNAAITTLYFAQQPHIAHVYSFEPFTPTYEVGLSNIHLNPDLEKKITAYPFGLSDQDKSLEILYDPDYSGGMSTTCDRFTGEDSRFLQENARIETVQIRNVASVLPAIFEKHPEEKIIVKIDTEGAEFNILQALDESGLLKKIHIVMIEYHFQSPQELKDRLLKNNFVVLYKNGQKDLLGNMLYAVRQVEPESL